MKELLAHHKIVADSDIDIRAVNGDGCLTPRRYAPELAYSFIALNNLFSESRYPCSSLWISPACLLTLL